MAASRVRKDKTGRWWARGFATLSTCPSPFATKREALAWAARNEAMVKETTGATDEQEAAVVASLAPRVRPVRRVRLSSVLASVGGEPPGGWSAADVVA